MSEAETDKVVPLFDSIQVEGNEPETLQADEDVVAQCEQLLQLAQEGKLQALGVAGMLYTADGKLDRVMSGIIGGASRSNPIAFLGLLEYLKSRFVTQMHLASGEI